MKSLFAVCVVLVILASLPLVPTKAQDFELTGNQQLTINTPYQIGHLKDNSIAYIVPGGSVTYRLFLNSSSSVNIIGGSVSFCTLYDSTTLNISDGSLTDTILISAHGSMNVTGGTVNNIYAMNWPGGGTVNISGGRVAGLAADDYSVITFNGQNFTLGSGLSLSGNQVLGIGFLSGEWLDGTPWTVNIWDHYSTATINLVPEPATLLLLGLGGILLSRWNQ